MTGKLSRWRTAKPIGVRPLAVRCRTLSSKRRPLRYASRSFLLRHNVELLVVATPPYTHAELCTTALANGVHVLCEKPLARDVDEAERMCFAATASDHLAVVDFQLRLTGPVAGFAIRSPGPPLG